MNKFTPEELNQLRCYASDYARTLWEHKEVGQLEMLRDYVQICIDRIDESPVEALDGS